MRRKLPAEMVSRFESVGEDADGQFAVGVELAARQTQALLDEGVPGIHYYVMNRSDSVAGVLAAVSMVRQP